MTRAFKTSEEEQHSTAWTEKGRYGKGAVNPKESMQRQLTNLRHTEKERTSDQALRNEYCKVVQQKRMLPWCGIRTHQAYKGNSNLHNLKLTKVLPVEFPNRHC